MGCSGSALGIVRRAAWIVGLIAGSSLASAQERPILKLHDLRGILAVDQWSPTGVDWRSHLHSAFLECLETEQWPIPLEDAVTSERILGEWHLEQGVLWYLGEGWPDQEFPLGQSGEFLRVVATPDTQEKVAEFIGLIERRASRTVFCEAFVFPAAAVRDLRHSVLTPSEVEALLATATPLDHSCASVPFGRVAALGATSVRSVLYDFDVEVYIAGQGPADPQVTVVQEGTQIGVVVRELANGELLLRTWGRRGFMHESPREIELEYLGGTKLQLPRMTTSRAAGSACLADGGGLLLGQSWNGDGVWLVTVRTSGGDASDREAWIPLAGLTAAPMITSAPWTFGPQPSGGLIRDPDSDPLAGRDLGHTLDEEGWLSLIAESLELENSDPPVAVFDGALCVREDVALHGEVHRLVREWEAPATRTVEFDLRFGLVEREVGVAILRGEYETAELVGSLDQRLRGACRLGDTLTVVGGQQENYLKDIDTEVAQAVIAADPIVDTYFQGVSFWCHPTILTSGELLALVELEYQQGLDDWQRETVVFGSDRSAEARGEAQPRWPQRALLEVRRSARADLSLVIRPEMGEWSLLACHSLPHTDDSFVAVLRVGPAGEW